MHFCRQAPLHASACLALQHAPLHVVYAVERAGVSVEHIHCCTDSLDRYTYIYVVQTLLHTLSLYSLAVERAGVSVEQIHSLALQIHLFALQRESRAREYAGESVQRICRCICRESLYNLCVERESL